MDDETPDSGRSELESRPPEQKDLVALCRELNSLRARYLICGGFAVIHAGYPRFTGDIDFLIDPAPENEARVYQALEILTDKAVRQLDPGDVARFVVCRVADDVVVDLMASAGGIGYADASAQVVMREIDGVSIPFASPLLLWRMKRHTHRAKDESDLVFLRQLLEKQGIALPE